MDFLGGVGLLFKLWGFSLGIGTGGGGTFGFS